MNASHPIGNTSRFCQLNEQQESAVRGDNSDCGPTQNRGSLGLDFEVCSQHSQRQVATPHVRFCALARAALNPIRAGRAAPASLHRADPPLDPHPVNCHSTVFCRRAFGVVTARLLSRQPPTKHCQIFWPTLGGDWGNHRLSAGCSYVNAVPAQLLPMKKTPWPLACKRLCPGQPENKDYIQHESCSGARESPAGLRAVAHQACGTAVCALGGATTEC